MLNALNSLKIFPRKFQQMDIWQKSLLIISALFFSALFIENFVFSNSFSAIQLREIDDTAFQYSIRNIHESISSFKFDRLIKLNDYGYGWIYWIIVGLITYPFYLLALVTDFYVPLIALPRDISLAFTIGSSFFIYKSLSFYSKDEFLKFMSMILLMSFPAFGFFSMRFGTVSQVMFFSTLAFYLTIRKDDYEKKDLRNIAISAALCVGTKISGALILPLLGLIMADRMQWKMNKETFKKAKYFLLNFLFFFILFSDPASFLIPFKPEYFHSYIDALKNNSHLALQDNFLQIMTEVLGVGYLNIGFASAAIGFLFLNLFYKERYKRDFLFMALWMVFTLSLLVKIMSMGCLYIIHYALAVMYLLVFAILFLEKWGRLGKVVAVAFVIMSFLTNYSNISSGFYSDIKYFKLLQEQMIVAKVAANDSIKKLIPDPKENKEQKVNVLMDYRAIFPYSHFDRENLNAVFAFDNIQKVRDQIKGDFDYISLNKTSPYFLPDQEFSDFIAKLKNESELTDQVESRKIVQKLMDSKKFEDVEYEILLNENNIIFFGKRLVK